MGFLDSPDFIHFKDPLYTNEKGFLNFKIKVHLGVHSLIFNIFPPRKIVPTVKY